jgi:hypothetical protein
VTLRNNTQPVCYRQLALRPTGDMVIPAVLKFDHGIRVIVVVSDLICKILEVSCLNFLLVQALREEEAPVHQRVREHEQTWTDQALPHCKKAFIIAISSVPTS